MDWATLEKKKQGGWGYGMSRGTEEIEGGSSRGLIKNNVEYPGRIKKKSWNFHGSWFQALKFLWGVTQSF